MDREIAAPRVPLLLVACATTNPQQPETPDELIRVSNECLTRGDAAGAAELLWRALTTHPRHPGALLHRARLSRMQGRPGDALRDLRQLIGMEGGHGFDHRRLLATAGDLLFEMGRYEESAKFLTAGRGDVGSDLAAKASLVTHLPAKREPAADVGVELPLVQGPVPRLVCRLGAVDQSLVVDTGSSRTTLSRSFAAEAGVRHVTAAGLGRDSLGNRFATWLGVLPSLSIGECIVRQLPVAVVENQQLQLGARPGRVGVRGVIGLDVISGFRIVLDRTRGSIALLPRSPLVEPRTVVCVLRRGVLLVPVELEGAAMWFALDTGASHTSLTEAGLALVPGGAQLVRSDHRSHRTVAGRSVVVRQVDNLHLRVSSVEFSNVNMPVTSRLREGGFPVHGVLGYDLLARCRLTLDGHSLLLEASDTVAPASQKSGR